MHKTGDLCEGTFLLIVSVTGRIEVGSWRADRITGDIYFMLLFYELFAFFFPWVECPIYTFFKSHMII